MCVSVTDTVCLYLEILYVLLYCVSIRPWLGCDVLWYLLWKYETSTILSLEPYQTFAPVINQ